MEEAPEDEVLFPDIYVSAKRSAERILDKFIEAWEVVKPVYERVEARISPLKGRLRDNPSSYRVSAVDSTFTSAMALRGYKANFILLAAVFYPDPKRPIFSFFPVRNTFEEEEFTPSFEVKYREVLMMRQVMRQHGDSFDVLVRDGDFPPTYTLFPRSKRKLAEISHEVMKMAQSLNKGVSGLVKRISTSLIAYRFMDDFQEFLDSLEGIKRFALDLLSDSMLADVLLNPGEFLLLEKYGEEFNGSSFIAGYFSSLRSRDRDKHREEIERRLEEYPLFKEVQVIYYKPMTHNPGLVKLTGFNLDLVDFASFSSQVTSGGQFPDYINLADMACLEHAKHMKPDLVMFNALNTTFRDKKYTDKLKYKGKTLRILGIQNVQKYWLYFPG